MLACLSTFLSTHCTTTYKYNEGYLQADRMPDRGWPKYAVYCQNLIAETRCSHIQRYTYEGREGCTRGHIYIRRGGTRLRHTQVRYIRTYTLMRERCHAWHLVQRPHHSCCAAVLARAGAVT